MICRWKDAPLLRRVPLGLTSSRGRAPVCHGAEGVERGSGGGGNRGQPDHSRALPRSCPNDSGDRLRSGIAGVTGGVDGLQGNRRPGRKGGKAARVERVGCEQGIHGGMPLQGLGAGNRTLVVGERGPTPGRALQR